jgi:hypothetical protein
LSLRHYVLERLGFYLVIPMIGRPTCMVWAFENNAYVGRLTESSHEKCRHVSLTIAVSLSKLMDKGL